MTRDDRWVAKIWSADSQTDRQTDGRVAAEAAGYFWSKVPQLRTDPSIMDAQHCDNLMMRDDQQLILFSCSAALQDSLLTSTCSSKTDPEFCVRVCVCVCVCVILEKQMQP